ncbi:MAG: ABC transporter ATP-binding protein [Tissierellaceae bacterium]|nr:ABC transporter ATP-binding protein [Tissierellaceae bacterium]
MTDNYVVDMENICKYYGNVRANDQVNLKVKKGEIHAIVGENGAGKTTLMNILYGLVQPDFGRIAIDGKEVIISSPRKAIELGIGMVHQHFKLIEDFTVAENICLGNEPVDKRGLIDKNKMISFVTEISKQFGLKVEPKKKVSSLSIGLLQRVEILKSLSRGADILILDEPTAVLTPMECEELFETFKKMREQGKTIIIITHKLNEVMAISDNITILSKGKTKGTLVTSETSADEIASKMMGENMGKPYLERIHKENSKPLLEIKDLSVIGEDNLEKLRKVTLTVKEGEILTIAGVEGSGQTELVESILGFRKIASGTINAEGINIADKSVKDRRNYCSFVPEDRIKTGLSVNATVGENIIGGYHSKGNFRKGMFMNFPTINKKVHETIDRYQIKTASQYMSAQSLSGGNQQKIVVGRELEQPNKILVIAQPTRGVDIGSSRFIHTQLMSKRNEGVGILLISTDLDEVFLLSDRIAVMFEGKIVAFLNPKEVTHREVGLYMTGAKVQEELIREGGN